MSQKYDPRRAVAAKLAAERARQRRQRRIQSLVIGGVVAVFLLAIAGGVTWAMLREQGAGDPNAAPAGVVDGGAAIPVGDPNAPVTLDVYEDFRCPACAGFETTYGPVLGELVDQGKLRIEYHLASFIDDMAPGDGSVTAANAAACAQDAGRFRPFHDLLYANQPAESVDGFTENRVLELAGQVEGLRGGTFDSCVREGTYRQWVRSVQVAFNDEFEGRISTPTLILDGQVLQSTDVRGTPELESPEALRAAIEERAAAAATGGTTTPAGAGTPGGTPAVTGTTPSAATTSP